ncbi:hypothetical protein PGTUg99_030229 [Puccinia graminis f. sp. tritici]|uniref:Uncharacterized protein n=1 Tax=Puccinia graminis f. sp. tritici TaxID=56615 RepID=A0A5B0R6X1_PUCGR|nr:hypothetical protein PGTUg99_030229 [Puccinia graminis f. sp. tritici]
MLPSCPSKRAPPDTRRGSQLDLPQDNTRAGHSPQTIRLQRRPLSIWTVEEQQKPSADKSSTEKAPPPHRSQSVVILQTDQQKSPPNINAVPLRNNCHNHPKRAKFRQDDVILTSSFSSCQIISSLGNPMRFSAAQYLTRWVQSIYHSFGSLQSGEYFSGKTFWLELCKRKIETIDSTKFSLSTFASVEALFRSDIAGHPIDKAFSSAHLTQSDHSRRGSMSSQRHHSSNAPHAPLHHLHGLPTTQTSMPKLTLGNRSRYNEGVHPYDLILPGEETHRIPVRTRVLSAATAPATSVASDNQSKSFRVGARRFTQSGHASVHFDPLTRTINRSSVHGRRYSNAVREPSAAAASISSSNAGNPIHQSYHRLLVLFTSKKQWCL